jgi:hypothetical protein
LKAVQPILLAWRSYYIGRLRSVFFRTGPFDHRWPPALAAVAPANKMARIAFVIVRGKTTYRAVRA